MLDTLRPVTGRPRLRPAVVVRACTAVWNWRSAARCRTEDAENLFVTGADQREAREFCLSCPVRTECSRTPWITRSSSACGAG